MNTKLNLPKLNNLPHSLLWRSNDYRNQARMERLARDVAIHARDTQGTSPTIIFRATSGLLRLDQNAAFSLLTAWGLRLSGYPVIHFTCHSGLSRCVLGVNRDDYSQYPPCKDCITHSGRAYTRSQAYWFGPKPYIPLRRTLEELVLKDLSDFHYEGLPLGRLALPSMRWTLRRHTLPDAPPTRFLYREFILSAYNVARNFMGLMAQTRPGAVVVFNGTFYPEATVRWLCNQNGVRVVSHEVGMRPYTGFFTTGEATAYPVEIPDSFALNRAQEMRLDTYLQDRFQGNFSMAGIQFWPEMRGLDASFRSKMAQFKQVVPVFTNVVFDTSQVHANTVFPDMFAWLDTILDLIRAHPDTLFVIRAHPDEMREHKESRESVAQWVAQKGIRDLPNAIFIDSNEFLSSYELIQASKFVMVYNSSIGLEASLMGAPVLCGGKARYTQTPCVFFPSTPGNYHHEAERFIRAETIDVPVNFRENARRFLYYQLYKVSLPFDNYLEAHTLPGFVKLRRFGWQDLLPERSETIKTIVDGVRGGGSFVLPG